MPKDISTDYKYYYDTQHILKSLFLVVSCAEVLCFKFQSAVASYLVQNDHFSLLRQFCWPFSATLALLKVK